MGEIMVCVAFLQMGVVFCVVRAYPTIPPLAFDVELYLYVAIGCNCGSTIFSVYFWCFEVLASVDYYLILWVWWCWAPPRAEGLIMLVFPSYFC